MEDKEIMENELSLVKGVCDLYLHGTIESSTAEVHNAFKNALKESLNIQNKLYNLMKDKGWYKPCDANQDEIQKLKDKYQTSI